jgi:hypothetical protein
MNCGSNSNKTGMYISCYSTRRRLYNLVLFASSYFKIVEE